MKSPVAVLLAGGRGARLRPFTMSIPKPLLPLGEVPIIEIVIRQLAAAGIERVVVTLGHLAPLFTASIGDGSQWGVNVEYCREDEPLGTAGPLKLVENSGDSVLVMNGDILTTLDYHAMLSAHRARKAAATIALHRRDVFIDYGVILSDASDDLVGFDEKPTISYDVSMGINILSREAIEMIPAGVKYDMPDLLMALVAAGKKVSCYRTDCYWQDIGRFDDYQQASADFTESPSRFLRPDK